MTSSHAVTTTFPTTTTTILPIRAIALLNVTGTLLFEQPAFDLVSRVALHRALSDVTRVSLANISVAKAAGENGTVVTYGVVTDGLLLNSQVRIALTYMVQLGTLLQALQA